jgi:hypothetical protein
MERVVAQLPPGQRVVSALMDPNLRVFSLLHVIDRACLGAVSVTQTTSRQWGNSG